MTELEIVDWMTERVAAMLEIKPEEVDPTESFASQGLDSMALLELTGDLSTELGLDLSTSLVWEHPSIDQLSAYLAATSSQNTDEPAMVPVSRDTPAPLTFSQERNWRHAQAGGADVRQTVTLRLEMKGDLDEKLMDWSLTEIVRRHEILRTNFKLVGDAPAQIINQAPTSTLQIDDCSGEADPEAYAWKKNSSLRDAVMDLAEGPLISFTLYRMGPENYRLNLLFNHIVGDEVSVQVLKNELINLYRGQREGSGAAPNELEIQVADFAWWQRRWLDEQGPAFAKQLAWWREYHENAPPKVPAFTFRRATPPDPSETPGNLALGTFSQKTYQALRRVAASENATLAMITFTAFFVVLQKYTGQTGLLVGNYVSDRRRPKVYSLIGYFINLVVLKSPDFAGKSFIEALREVRGIMEQVVANQDLPFETLCDTLAKEGRHGPYPSLMFQHVKITAPDMNLPDVTVTPWTRPSRIAIRYWGFTLKSTEANGELSAKITFDASLYELEGVQNLLNDYVALLDEVAAESGV